MFQIGFLINRIAKKSPISNYVTYNLDHNRLLNIIWYPKSEIKIFGAIKIVNDCDSIFRKHEIEIQSNQESV